MINFEALVALGMIDGEDAGLFEIVDTAEEAWTALIRRGFTAQTPLRIPRATKASDQRWRLRLTRHIPLLSSARDQGRPPPN